VPRGRVLAPCIAAMRARPLAICALWFFAAACSGTSSSISVNAPTAAKCEVAVENATRDAAPADGISSTLAISTNRDCTWTASTTAAWIAITSATSGQGSETLTYKVAANAEPVQRRGTLEVNNTQVSVLQEAAPCRYNVTPSNTTVSASGGEIPFAIETLTGCAWTVSSAAAWIAPPATANGNRSGTVTLTVARNTAPVARTGTATIGPQTITIQQAAAEPEAPVPAPAPGPTPGPTPEPAPSPSPTPPAPCVYDLSPTSNNVGSDATTGSVQVIAGSGCAWTATENSTWLTITAGGSGNGNGKIDYRVSANTGAARSATITAAGKTFTIAQAAAPPPACSFSISPTSQNVADAGGSGSIAITASANTCAWTATTSAPWIGLSGARSGNGNATVAFTVAANTTTTARSATIAAAGKTFTVTQAAAPPPPPPPPTCTFSIAPTAQNVADTATSGSVAVTASAPTCAWTAASGAPWLILTSGASGVGNAIVTFNVDANLAAARSGTIAIAGQTFTVSQAAAPAPPPCTFTIAPTSQNVPETATSGSVAVTASTPACAWAAASGAPWLIVTGSASGVGNGVVTFNVDANLAAARTGTIAIAGQTFTVSQAAPPPPPPPPCTFSISPGSESVPAAGGNSTVMVNASASTCAWTATSNNADWLVVTSGATGTGSGPVLYSASPNMVDSDRTGTITVAGQTFTVTQPRP
jgi:hypothetical protein